MNIIPRPSKYEARSGSVPVPSSIQIVADPHLRTVADYFVREAAARGLTPRVEQSDDPAALVRLRTASGAGGVNSTDEAYELHVSDSHVTIEASSQSGAFYGAQTLLQMLDGSPGEIPCVAISDRPRYRWRGMHLDVCRHFFDTTFIKRYLDLLAMHKFNTFHWHLTEDQGWRLQIGRYPKLTEIGAWRESNSRKYGGFYTQDDVREILEYAAQRCITVVPEIELPGHAMAALAAYPELSCTGGPFEVQTQWGIFDDVFCAGNESTFDFLENVLAEVIGLFPSEYIHIGGDECPKTRWKSCPKCQHRIETEGLRNEDHLQSWFVTRISYFLRESGRRLIGWDEILEGGLAPEAAVMSWRGVAGGIEAARQGHDVVMTPTTHCYFRLQTGRPQRRTGGSRCQHAAKHVRVLSPLPGNSTTDRSGSRARRPGKRLDRTHGDSPAGRVYGAAADVRSGRSGLESRRCPRLV